MKRKLVGLSLIIIMIIGLLTLTGCNNNETKFKGMTDIDTAYIQAEYDGGKHKAYYLDDDDIAKLEKMHFIIVKV